MTARHRSHPPPVRELTAPGTYLCGLTWDGTYLWHSDQGAGQIFCLDPADGRVVREIDCAWVRADLTHHDGQLLQVGGRPKRLVSIDPLTGAVTGHREVLPSSGRLTGVEATAEGVWMCLRDPLVLQLRDPETLSVRREYPVAGIAPSGLTVAGDLVVYGDFPAQRLHLVDAATGEPAGAIALPGRPTGLTFDGRQLWYCDFDSRRIRSIATLTPEL